MTNTDRNVSENDVQTGKKEKKNLLENVKWSIMQKSLLVKIRQQKLKAEIYLQIQPLPLHCQ